MKGKNSLVEEKVFQACNSKCNFSHVSFSVSQGHNAKTKLGENSCIEDNKIMWPKYTQFSDGLA